MGFQDYQRAFTAHIRSPKERARPKGVPERRMRVYNELLYNNVEGFLLACFPVCRQVLGSRRWTRLVRAFFRDHACHTPYFRQIPEEFLRYLQDGWERPEDYPEFLPELAHFEWVELDLETSNKDAQVPPHDVDGDLLAGCPLLNPVLRLLAYRYPVERISPRHKPAETPAEPTFIAAFRDADLQVRFLAINAATARLLSLLQEDEGLTGCQALDRLAEHLPHLDPVAVQGYGRELLESLRQEGVVLGCRP
jgi:hypothetical protein